MYYLVDQKQIITEKLNQRKIIDFQPENDLNTCLNSDKSIKKQKLNPSTPSNPTKCSRVKPYSGNDPFEFAEILQKLVCKNGSRKYYRFRGGRFYGGIASADCVGCILDCVFCWSYKPRCNPEYAGKFYTGKQVAEKLVENAKKNNYTKVRITGNEPTLCKEHLLGVLEHIPNNLLFILETNGILLDKDYINSLKPFKHHIHTRVSLKGVIETQFELITGMAGEFLKFQFQTLRLLIDSGISCNAAIMSELVNDENMKILFDKLNTIDNRLVRDLELEYLIMYPFIDEELKKRGIDKNFKPI